MSTTNGSPTRRPRNRRALILAAAMDRFRETGYQATGMEDIASAVGITAGGLYRHFRGKQELLGVALLDSTEQLLDVMEESDDLASLTRAVASFSLDHRSYPVVWDRETRHLSALHQDDVRQRHAQIAAALGTALRAARPDVAPQNISLLGWATVAVLASPSYHRTELPRRRYEELLRKLAEAVCRTELSSPAPPAGGSSAGTASRPGLSPASRREALLAAAVPLFAERGFQSVSMEDIGAVVGISRLSVYHQFPEGKGDLLAAVLHRASEAKWATLVRDLAESGTPREALERLLRSHAQSTVLDNGTGALLLVSELAHFPTAAQEAMHRSQVDYVAEWVALLRACRPDLDQAEARVTVHAALTVINLLPRRPENTARPDATSALVELGLAVLGIQRSVRA
ncbi:TetR/AcrR family transcriptional regulator [Streptomyces sp. NBC_00683]|uniref:TetR/AcrR family transcriptional regulator n=1 Tax=Streptomyces sp. NBC_00683 TaxID=2903670 RepID=UPI002E2F29F1|nr:TetR/AcrR family transcriptional regulator [Streptomyces sp. NBC_00683]